MNTATIADVTNRPPDLFITSATLRQRNRAPNLRAEAAAFSGLSKIVADEPHVAIRHLLEIGCRLCHAETAGLSLLRYDAAGQVVVRWESISGALAPYEGTDTPRQSSPCGLCLDAGVMVLVSRPERAFPSLYETKPAIVEDLIVPLYDNAGTALGTLWIAQHGTTRFCSDDMRIAEQLAAQLMLTLKLLERAREHQYALALLESHQVAQHNLLAHDLCRERTRRKQAEASERHSRQALGFKDAVIREVNHRTKNTLQAAATLLSLQARATSSAQVRLALLDSCERLQLLAKVHELLYSSADSTQTVFMPRLLEALGDALQQSFAKTPALVRLEITSDSLALPVDQAIPMALLVNEAVTNAYKHAFPNDSSGGITVNLRRTPENVLTLRIADTGIGLQLTGEIGIGIELVRTFAAQLCGTLTFSTPADEAGTVITLTIDPAVKHSPAPGAAALYGEHASALADSTP